MMFETNLRKVGGSVMLAVPPALLDLLNLEAGAAVGLTVEGERLIIKAAPRRRYALAELLAASDYSQKPTSEDNDWVNGANYGGEII